MRPIDADDLLEIIEKYCGDYDCHDSESFDKQAVRMAIRSAPTLTPPNEPLTLDKKRAIAESCLHYSKSGCCLLRGYAPLDCPRCKEWQSNEANVALTLEQLREMNGEPVYIIASDMGIAEWNVIAGKEWITVAYDVPRNGFKAVVEGVGFINGRAFRIDSYGTDWFAYRRPAEGEEDA